MASSPWDRFEGVLPPEVIAYLEDRDRQLETYLDQLAANTVSVTATTQAIWTPAAHADTHSTSGADWVSPGSIGADTPSERDAAIAALQITDPALFWMSATNDEAAPSMDEFWGEQAQRIMESDGPATVTYPTPAAAGGGLPGHIIQDEAAALTYRDTISFQGPGVTAADSGFRTIVTIPGDTAAAAAAQATADADEALMWMLVNP